MTFIKPIIKYLLLYIILSLPLILSFHYSYEKNVIWLLSSLLFLFLSSLSILSLKAQTKNWWNSLFLIALFVLIFLLDIIQFISFYLQGEGFNDRFFFHFTLNTIQETWAGYPLLLFAIILIMLFFVISIYINTRNRAFKVIPIYLSIIILVFSTFLNSGLKDFTSQSFKIQKPTNHFEITKLSKLGLNQNAILQDKLDTYSGKNLVLIYLESLERIYLENSIFKDLTPNINNILKESLSFTNISQTPGTGWTIAGIIASQCGTPLLYYNNIIADNDIIQNGFLTKVKCLGDILNKAGYIQEYLGGASKKFAGKGLFFKDHHYDEVKGYNDLILKIKNKNYKTGWGLYDDSLFEIAATEYVRLANQNKPFNLTLLTLDTHAPGHFSHSCNPYSYKKNSILDAVHCTDQLLDKFLNKISRHPSFKDTVVVIFSDHLAMRNSAEKFYPKPYERKLFFAILNSSKKGLNHKLGTHMDVAPTILDAIGVKHTAHFLVGRNLFKHSDTVSANFLNDETIHTIKYVNSNIFTKGTYSLCKGEYLLTNETEHSIKIGDKPVFLSFGGMPVTKSRFQKDLAIIAFIDDKGVIKQSSVIHLVNLPHTLYANQNDFFFLITPNKTLPYGLNDVIKTNSGNMSVLFGKLDHSIINLGSFSDLEHVQIDGSECENLIKIAPNTNIIKGTIPTLSELCSNDNQYIASYTSRSKEIIIPRVGVDNIIVKATLTQETPRKFAVKEFSRLDLPINFSGKDYCYASYTNDILYIPSIIIDGTKYSLELKTLSKHPFTFEIKEDDVSLFMN